MAVEWEHLVPGETAEQAILGPETPWSLGQRCGAFLSTPLLGHDLLELTGPAGGGKSAALLQVPAPLSPGPLASVPACLGALRAPPRCFWEVGCSFGRCRSGARSPLPERSWRPRCCSRRVPGALAPRLYSSTAASASPRAVSGRCWVRRFRRSCQTVRRRCGGRWSGCGSHACTRRRSWRLRSVQCPASPPRRAMGSPSACCLLTAWAHHTGRRGVQAATPSLLARLPRARVLPGLFRWGGAALGTTAPDGGGHGGNSGAAPRDADGGGGGGWRGAVGRAQQPWLRLRPRRSRR